MSEQIKKYYDKNGVEIAVGSKIRFDGDGKLREVFQCQDYDGNQDLGIVATNPEFLKYHPYWEIEYYPLSNFPRSIIEVVTE